MNSDWKEKLKIYYKTKYWQIGIDLMEEVIFNDKDNRDAYLNICNFLTNILAFEDFDINYVDYYECLFNKYFEISYEKFKNDPIYLHFIARSISYNEGFLFNREINYQDFFYKALELEPDNIIFRAKIYNIELFALHKAELFNDESAFGGPEELKIKTKNMEDEINEFCEIAAHEYDNIKEKYSKIGKVGELEMEYFETFCYKQLVKIGKIQEKVFPKID